MHLPARRNLVIVAVVVLVAAAVGVTVLVRFATDTTSPTGLVRPVRSCASMPTAPVSPRAEVSVDGATAISGTDNVVGGYAACRLTGVVAGHSHFTLLLPTSTYTGRYLQLGCGGFCGTSTVTAPFAASGCAPLTGGGFAVGTDDMGHVGASTDASFGADPQQRITFAYLSEHELVVAAKAVLTSYYGRAPDRAYYDGCSQGGREGLVEVQRYPDDFDGVLAGAPALALNEENLFYQGWNALANRSPTGAAILTAADLAPLHRTVLAACDALDGTTDGLLADPLSCHWDPGSIACPSGQRSTASAFCLSAAQVETVRKLYGGPRDPDGHLLFPGWEVRGSEANWAGWMVPSTTAQDSTYSLTVATNWLRYLAYPQADAARTTADLRFTASYYDALAPGDGLYDATDPDLHAFAAHGGKLILWHGWADPAVSPITTIAYYTAVRRTLGVTASDEIARLFLLPGVGHCVGGQGPSSFDGLAALTDWVEHGTAPDEVITQRVVGGKPVATRPAYPYPSVAVADENKADPSTASGFAARAPRTPFDGRPDWLGSFGTGYERACAVEGGSLTCHPASR